MKLEKFKLWFKSHKYEKNVKYLRLEKIQNYDLEIKTNSLYLYKVSFIR